MGLSVRSCVAHFVTLSYADSYAISYAITYAFSYAVRFKKVQEGSRRSQKVLKGSSSFQKV